MRFNRVNFFPSNNINGIAEPDLANNYFNTLFETTKDVTYYTVRNDDLQRPDIISYKFYGTDEYWWVVMKYNNIDDIWNDLIIGKVLSIPDKTDIDSFYLKVKSRIRQTIT